MCKFCRRPCWLSKPCKNAEVNLDRTVEPDSLEAFFYRFLFLDMICQRKEEREISEQNAPYKYQIPEVRVSPEPEPRFIPRAPRPETPDQDLDALGDDICVRCGLTVYQAELRQTRGKSYHSLCYTCFRCHRFLDAMTVTDGGDGEAYCKTCYKYKFMKDNSYLGGGNTTSILAKVGDSDRCPRCYGKVFQAEQMLSAHGVYHRGCFRCAEQECGRALDSTTYCDSPTGLVFCKTCYSKHLGPKGFGFGGTTPTLVSVTDDNVDNKDQEDEASTRRPTPLPHYKMKLTPATPRETQGPKCPRCSKAVFLIERVYVGRKQWHRFCLNCATCSRRLDSSSLNEVGEGEQVFCPKCYKNYNSVETGQDWRKEQRPKSCNA